ncbi:MAG: tetratricopeptide repeat protein [candidate division KSB1 bacterium]|nr:tetratricopeptide repeat protein [candidate division KSB1 bacterium]
MVSRTRSAVVTRLLACLSLTLLLTSACAYYNTFYNAKQFYKKGEDQRLKRRAEKPTQAEIEAYRKAAEKAGKVIQNYPKSRYVDDAILLMGKAFYWQEQIGSAQRKFEELLTYFPDSELAPEARLWLARCLLAQNEFAQAEETLNALLAESRTRGHVRDEAFYYLGELQYARGRYRDAIQAYSQAARRISDPELRTRCFFRLGESATHERDYALAADSYRRAAASTRTVEQRFDALLKYGLSLKEQGRYDQAIRVFERILRDGSMNRFWPDAKYQIADAAYAKGEVDYALRWLQSIVQEHPRTDAAANAHFLLGRLYLERYADYKTAKDHFDQVRSASSRAEVVPQAVALSQDLDQLLRLRELVSEQEKQLARGRRGMVQVGERRRYQEGELWWVPDTTLSRRDSLLIFARLDTLVRRGVDLDSAAWTLIRQDTLLYWIFPPDSMVTLYQRWSRDDSVWAAIERIQQEWEQMTVAERRALAAARAAAQQKQQQAVIEAATPENVAKNKLKLGELFLFRFGKPDTALAYYMDIVQKYPDAPVAPQALYSIAYILETIRKDTVTADSVLSRLITRYPESPQAKQARRELGLAVAPSGPNGARALFLKAESLLWDRGDPRAALDSLAELVARYPDNELAPKALYAAGWICENVLGANERAAQIYQLLLDQYPNTPYAKRVRPVIEEFRHAQEQARRADQMSQAGQPAEKAPAPREPARSTFPDTAEAVPAPPTASSSSVPQVAELVDEPPEPIGGVQAVQANLQIPPQAQNSVLPGTVIVEVLVDEVGAVRDVRFTPPLRNEALEFAALSAIRNTRWKPATYQNQPVAAWTQIALDFLKARR